MNFKARKGFTLMELLLVVAVLAIVAAAAFPVFFSGAKDAMAEAKKATYLAAYGNSLSLGNLQVSATIAKGGTMTTGTMTSTSIDTGARVFTHGTTTKTEILTPGWDGTNVNVCYGTSGVAGTNIITDVAAVWDANFKNN
ncbi:MAG: prepilin-type N-terminal cleavage/methylation domain-containing protein [Candidatus Riflebacteria bacterium]|nr:prepilin-type N-terminal cleavage/methylation domain-containing protein [Candidatus Riflebacteria bacterium]